MGREEHEMWFKEGCKSINWMEGKELKEKECKEKKTERKEMKKRTSRHQEREI